MKARRSIMMDRRYSALVAVLTLVVIATACQRSEPPSAAPPTPAAQPAATPFKVSLLEVGKEVGANKRVTTPTTSFGANDTVYASVVTEGAAPSVALKARWTYQDGQVIDESTQTIAPTGPAVTEFHISKPSGWPAGKYKVEISANGTVATSRDFEVAG
jgi:hypothetical protein